MQGNQLRPSTSRSLGLSLATLLPVLPLLLGGLAGCSGEEVPSAPGAAPEGVEAHEARVVSGDEGRSDGQAAPAHLDTGVDLSKLARKEPSMPEETDEPATPSVIGPELPPPAAATNAKLSMAEGSEREVDFGELIQGDVRSHVFELESGGPDPLVIERIKPSCGCTIAQTTLEGPDGESSEYVVGQPIPAGTKIVVTAEVNTAGKMGAMSSTISVYSNDPEGVLNLSLKGKVQPVLIAEQPTINFNRITVADVVTGEARVHSDVLEPYVLHVDQEFVPEPLAVTVEPIEPDDAGRSKDWKVVATLGPDTPEGMRTFPIRLYTERQDVEGDEAADAADEEGQAHGHAPTRHEVRLYVQAQVTGLVSADPVFVSFGLVRPGQEMVRSVKVRCFDGFELDPAMPVELKGLRGEEFALADSFSYKLEPTEETGVLDLTLTLLGLPEGHEGSFGGMVQLHVGHPSKDVLEVRFSGVCRSGVPAPVPTARATPADDGR